MIEEYVKVVVEFVQANQTYLLPIIFVVAFFECLAFVSILAPATLLFTAFGAIAGAAGIGLLWIGLVATVGSVLGYWVSYWIGLALGPQVLERRPLKGRPELVAKVTGFFERWGAAGIFISHFWGQVRPLAPLIAGVVRMPALPFHAANIAGSAGWSFGVFYASGTVGHLLK
jgi:membrane protein DedA with SNARE-associated domain